MPLAQTAARMFGISQAMRVQNVDESYRMLPCRTLISTDGYTAPIVAGFELRATIKATIKPCMPRKLPRSTSHE
jgi:hypothetical protein